MESLVLLIFLFVFAILLFGYPVAFSLSGAGLMLAFFGYLVGFFDFAFLEAIPNRIYNIMTNEVLLAVPLFIFMGTVLEKSEIAEELLNTMGLLFGAVRGGLAISVTLVGMLMAASTGIVGATVVTMGLLSLPTMLKRNYNPRLATGIICASGTLGQIIPPSIVLILLGEVISSAYQKSQLEQGIFSPRTVSVGDLFLGALFPGLLLVVMYIVYLIIIALVKPSAAPPLPAAERKTLLQDVPLVHRLLKVLFPPVFLIIIVLGSILGGLATPTEAAGVGSMGALGIALVKRKLSLKLLRDICYSTTLNSSMIFLLLVGASVFSLVFRGFGGDEFVRNLLTGLPGGAYQALLVVMLLMFLLGFFLDFIEITFVVIPLVAPILMTLGFDPIWLGVVMGLNLQTSFLTPPFGFSLFYLRGVAPASIKTQDIYRGVVPFIFIQLLLLVLIYFYQPLATWLPLTVYGK